MHTLATSDHAANSSTRDVARPAFVGRAHEVEVIDRALAQPPTIVLVEGEAGIGKSRLIQECLMMPAAGNRWRAALAACPPYRDYLTLGPVVDAVRGSCHDVADLPLSQLAGALRPLFPEWAADLPAPPEPLDDAKAARHRLFRALAEIIDRLGLDVLVLEDVHWADDATLEFLLFLASRSLARDLSLLVSYRPDDVPPDSLLLRLSSRMSVSMAQVRVTLGTLDVEDTARLVSSMLDDEPVSEEFAGLLHRHTDGIPLAVEESVRALRQRADVTRRDGRWVRRDLDDMRVPPSIRDAVLERHRALDVPVRQTLDAAAVLSQPADETVLARVADLTVDQARSALADAIATGLLDTAGDLVVFRHALIGRAVYESIPSPQRRHLHSVAGDILEQREPRPVAQLARHFRESGETVKWASYAEQTAERAIASGDHTTAIRALNELLATTDLPAPTQARIARRLADATLDRRENEDDLAARVSDTLAGVLESADLEGADQGEVRSRFGRLLMQRGERDAGLRELERAASYLDHNPVLAARTMTLLGWPLGSRWPAAVHRRWLRRAAEQQIDSAPQVDRLGLTVHRATALLLFGDEAGWELAKELPHTAGTLKERSLIVIGCSNFGSSALAWGRYAEARRWLAAGLEHADADGFTRYRAVLLSSQLHLDWFSGRWSALSDQATTLIETEGVEPTARIGATVVAGQLDAAQGLCQQAEERLCHILELIPSRGGDGALLAAAAALGRLHLVEGDASAAVTATDDVTSVLAAKDLWVWAADIAPVRVEALVAGDRLDEATHLVSTFERGISGRDAPAPQAALATCHALVLAGRGDQAHATNAFARAAAAWDELPRPYDALLARERQARCLLDVGRDRLGLDLLSEVLRGLTDLGATGDARRVSHHLREHGIDVAQPWHGGRRGYGDQLSPRELEVVRLVVAGRTNREIARTLSKSRRTVDGQLRSAMRKLSVSTRTALAVAAVETGVVSDAVKTRTSLASVARHNRSVT